MPESRPYDIVLFGATGFTGGLTADYLASAPSAPADLKWALAGRNLAKLEAVRDRLVAAAPPDRADALRALPLIVADSTDAASLRSVAEQTRVLVTTVGPYLRYGEPLVAACAAAGTAYLDLTGEPEFVDLMYLRYEEQARATGARLIHACGFDSIPHDLGALYTVSQLPSDVPIALEAFVRAGGTFSGGTYQSAVGAMSRLRESARVSKERRRAERSAAERGEFGPAAAAVVSGARKVHGVMKPPHRDPEAPGWVIAPPIIDPQIILRSARALDTYGPDFSYAHYIVTRSAKTTFGLIGGAGVLLAGAQLKPTRDLLLKYKSSGDGPDAEQRAKAWFTVKFVANAGGQRLVTQVSGGDPGYGETSKMLAEAALCIAFDDVPTAGGQLTSAVAMGQPLIDRLGAAGIRFENR